MTIALGANRLALSALQSGAIDIFRGKGFASARIEKAAENPDFAAMLTGREVSGLAYGMNLSPRDTAIISYGADHPGLRGLQPTEDSLAQITPMTRGWWAEPAISVAELNEDTSGLASLLGAVEADTHLPVSADARLCALAGERVSALWHLREAMTDASWIKNLDAAHQTLAETFVPSLREREEERDMYHVVHTPRTSVRNAIESLGIGVCVVAAMGPGRMVQLHTARSTNDERTLELSLMSLKPDWSEARWVAGLDGVRASGNNLSSLAEDFLKAFPSAAKWQVVGLRFASGLILPPVAANSDTEAA